MAGIRKNGEYLLTYVTEVGGFYKTHVIDDPTEYDKIVETGEYVVNLHPDVENRPPDVMRPVFVALSRVEKNYDFHNQVERSE